MTLVLTIAVVAAACLAALVLQHRHDERMLMLQERIRADRLGTTDALVKLATENTEYLRRLREAGISPREAASRTEHPGT